MKRTAIFPLTLALFCCALFSFSAAAQTLDPIQALTGQWEGPNAAINGKVHSLIAVFVPEDNGLKVTVSRYVVGERNSSSESSYYAVDPKFSPQGMSFTLADTKRDAFYEGLLSPDGQELAIFILNEP